MAVDNMVMCMVVVFYIVGVMVPASHDGSWGATPGLVKLRDEGEGRGGEGEDGQERESCTGRQERRGRRYYRSP